MDRYQRVEKPRAETPINENEIRITTQGTMRNYITYATSLLQRGSRMDEDIELPEHQRTKRIRLQCDTSPLCADKWEERNLTPNSFTEVFDDSGLQRRRARVDGSRPKGNTAICISSADCIVLATDSRTYDEVWSTELGRKERQVKSDDSMKLHKLSENIICAAQGYMLPAERVLEILKMVPSPERLSVHAMADMALGYAKPGKEDGNYNNRYRLLLAGFYNGQASVVLTSDRNRVDARILEDERYFCLNPCKEVKVATKSYLDKRYPLLSKDDWEQEAANLARQGIAKAAYMDRWTGGTIRVWIISRNNERGGCKITYTEDRPVEEVQREMGDDLFE